MKIRKCKKSDIQELFKLDRLLEEHPWNRRSKENWIWKYFGKNPAGKSIFYIALQNSKILASFAAIPIHYNLSGKKILASHSISMMVHPKWQNRGLIKYVVEKVLEQLKKKKLPFVYGYPNNRAYNLHKDQFGYEDVFEQITYGVKKKNFLKKKFEFNQKNYKIKSINLFNKELDFFFHNEKKKFDISVFKSSKFLNWRYLSRPDHKYFCYGIYDYNKKLKAYFILKKYKDLYSTKTHIVDYLYNDQNKLELCKLIIEKSAELAFKKFNSNEITFWCNSDICMQRVIKLYAFSKLNSRKMIYKVLNKKYKKLKKKWFFTMGDTLEIY